MRNFKRILSIALTLLVAICITACKEDVSPKTLDSTGDATKNEKIISKDKRFEVVEVNKDGQIGYTYTLYDSYENVVFEQTVVKEPSIKYITDDVLEIRTSHGTSAQSCTYFDLRTNKLSESCWNPSYVDGSIVAYMHYDENREPSTFLVVRDIFDSSKKYIEFDMNFSSMAVPSFAIKNIKLIDENTMEITYFSGENETEKTSRINIS